MQVLTLARRKTCNTASVLTRRCWCRVSPATCPIHALTGLYNRTPVGTSLFEGISVDSVTKVLRFVLAQLRVEDALFYCTHDLRRGHCDDLVASGQPLAVILAAGGWRSQAFRAYVDKPRLETNAVLQAILRRDEELVWEER